jgi:3-phosphoshikimate 1-carboxyvinyltransferase
MLIAKPNRENPPEDGETDLTDGPSVWPAPRALEPLSHTLSIPGSKSLTNRELVLAALAEGPSLIRSPLVSRDTLLMVDALRCLDVTIEEVKSSSEFGPDWKVAPTPELIGSTTIACGLAGTVMRFVPPVATLALGPTAFDGDEAARRRPMRQIISALRALGADISDDGSGSLPFTVHGTGSLRGGRVVLDASLSSQFVSGLLLSAPRFDEGVHVVHEGDRLPSIPHIDMTVAALRNRGVNVHSPKTGEWVVEPGPIRALDLTIEPDLSNAAPFLAAALIAKGSVTISGWPTQTTQVGDTLRELLPHFGGQVALSKNALTVTGDGSIRGANLDLSHAGELVPTLVALAALAESPSELTGISHIRHHETDRLAALVTEINRLGGRAEERDDGIRIEPAPLHGGLFKTYEDHRMATTAALIGLAVDGVEVENVETTAKTLPQFVTLWNTMLRTHSSSPL